MESQKKTISHVYLDIPFARYAVVTVSLPAISLFYCFWSAFLFRRDEVIDTDCKVENNIPSVSAVTGIRPQAYFWRICIGLHSAPRFFVGFMLYNYSHASLPHIAKSYQGLYKFLMHLCFWLYTIECFCLLSVSCISNKENYPLHEKIFVVFMITSIANMLFGTILFRWSRYKPLTEKEEKSYFWKKVMLAWISLSTVGLLIFFVRHRFYCIPGAFSVFSVFEYMIAYANMGYHVTAYYEFGHKHLLAADVVEDTVSNGCINHTAAVTNGHKKIQ